MCCVGVHCSLFRVRAIDRALVAFVMAEAAIPCLFIALIDYLDRFFK